MYDTWVIPTLIADLTALYRKANLAPIQSFKPFIQHTFHSLQAEKQKDYWTRCLYDSQPTLLKPSPAHAKAQSNIRRIPTFVALEGALQNVKVLMVRTQKSDVALPTLILVAFARTLAHHTSIPSPTLGLYQTGCSASFDGIHNLCAPCLNVTPLLVQEALSRNPLATARAVQSDLAARVPFEQSYLHDILEWVGSPHEPLFNTYMNILWHEGATAISSSPNDLLVPWQPGKFSKLAPTEPMPGKTAVDGLDVTIITEKNLFFDVARSLDSDAADFMIRCDAGLMEEKEVRQFVVKVAEQVVLPVRTIGDDVGNGC